MIVYRVIKNVYSYGKNGKMRNEFIDYQKGIISFPNCFYNHGLNTHHYKDKANYLHFFHFYESALEYILGIPSMGWGSQCFIAQYDIPENLLKKYKGFGLYPENIYSKIPILEYAIPFSELSDSFINGKIIQYSGIWNYEYSEEYKKYIDGDYEFYLENINETDKKFIKSFTYFYRK